MTNRRTNYGRDDLRRGAGADQQLGAAAPKWRIRQPSSPAVAEVEPNGKARPGRRAILSAAVSVMGEVGYDAASVRTMADRAGVSAAALYYHFGSKDGLLRDFLDEAWSDFVAHVERRLVAAPGRGFARLDAVVGALIVAQGSDRFAQLARSVAARDFVRLTADDRAVISAHYRRLRSLVDHVIRDGMRDGTFSIDDAGLGAAAVLLFARDLHESLTAQGRCTDDVAAVVRRLARAVVMCRTYT